MSVRAVLVLFVLFSSRVSTEAEAAPASAPTSGKALAPASPPAAGQPSSATADPRALLRQAMDLYLQGRYAQAAARLRPLVEARSLADQADQLEALRTYGIALFLSGARAGAERAFRDLLRRAPRERLDPNFVRPEAVRFFEGVRRRHVAEANRLVARSAPKGSAVVNLLPPWGQFQNEHRTKGWLLAGGLLTSAAVAATTLGVWYGMRGEAGTFDGNEKTAEALQVVNLVSAGIFAGLYLYGVVDGLYHYFRRRHARLGGEQAGPRVSIQPRGFQLAF